jgi:hypothetical protein
VFGGASVGGHGARILPGIWVLVRTFRMKSLDVVDKSV